LKRFTVTKADQEHINLNEYFVLLCTGRWINRDDPEEVIELSLVYQLRFSDKIAVRLKASPEAAKRD
jgi:hypothetical protein